MKCELCHEAIDTIDYCTLKTNGIPGGVHYHNNCFDMLWDAQENDEWATYLKSLAVALRELYEIHDPDGDLAVYEEYDGFIAELIEHFGGEEESHDT